MRQIVLDTETTGLLPLEGHRIIEIGCVEIIDRKITENIFQKYLNPERELDEGAAKISGLNAAFLQDKAKFFEVVEDFFAYIKDSEVIIHNAPFDVGFINHELRLIKHTYSNFTNIVKIFDTLELARRLHPGQRNNLDALCKRYRIDNSHRTYHGALLDAKILAEVYLAMTTGQTHFMLSNEDDEVNCHELEKIHNQSFAHNTNNLKIIHANEKELLEHKKYLGYIKTKSEGKKCIWEQE